MKINLIEYSGLTRPGPLYAVRRKTLFGYVYLDFEMWDRDGQSDECRYSASIWLRNSNIMFEDCLTPSFSLALAAYNSLMQQPRRTCIQVLTEDKLIEAWQMEIQSAGYIVHD